MNTKKNKPVNEGLPLILSSFVRRVQVFKAFGLYVGIEPTTAGPKPGVLPSELVCKL